MGIILKANEGQAVGKSGEVVPENICKAFVDAVRSGNEDSFQYELMRNKVQVRDIVDHKFYNQNLCSTILHCTDENKCLKLFQNLVSYGVDFKAIDDLKQTPLFWACKNGHSRVIRMLVENGINVNHVDYYGQNAIYYASAFGNVECVMVMH